MNRHWIIVLVVTALLLALALAGCSKSKATARSQQSQPSTASKSDVPDATAQGQQPQYYTRESYTTSKIDDLKQHAPFPLNVPSYLPDGYAFTSGTVNPEFQSNAADVDMAFAAEGKAVILVIESRGETLYASRPEAVGVETTNVKLGSLAGQMEKLSIADGSVINIITFKAKNLYHVINARGVPEAELLKVAQSLSQ